jgi:hypothetical protein
MYSPSSWRNNPYYAIPKAINLNSTRDLSPFGGGWGWIETKVKLKTFVITHYNINHPKSS